MASNGRSRCKNLVVLNPRKAGFIDIFQILFTKNIEKIKAVEVLKRANPDGRSTEDVEKIDFIESLEVKRVILEGRSLIFLSMFAQKILQKSKTLMSMIGSTSETCLNLFGNKNNFGVFLSGLSQGKIKLPKSDSSNFSSIIGLLDKRVELDKNIKPGDSKYTAALTVMASKIAYENKAFIKDVVEKIWKMDVLESYDCYDESLRDNTTQGFMFLDKNTNPQTIIVAFRGTELFNPDDWVTDVDISWFKFEGNIKGRIHGGFMQALGLKASDDTWSDEGAYKRITKDLKRHFRNNNRRLVITGHSLGGALAILFPTVLAVHKENDVLKRIEGVYTFGQPKVGDKKFGQFMEELFKNVGINYYRFVYSHDIVPRVPWDSKVLKFQHFGTCIYVNSVYERKDDNVEQKQYKNFFHEFAMKRMDAVWEIARSFVLPGMFGSEYKEGLLQQMFRLVGLVVPEIPAHGPQDYINATRLASYSAL